MANEHTFDSPEDRVPDSSEELLAFIPQSAIDITDEFREEIRTILDAVIENDPGVPDAIIEIGFHLAEKGNQRGTLLCARKAAALAPKLPPDKHCRILSDAATLLYQMEEPAEAEQLWLRAYGIADGIPLSISQTWHIAMSLAMVNRDQGREIEADEWSAVAEDLRAVRE